jgi:hypothetical protein
MIKIPYPNPSTDFDKEYVAKLTSVNKTKFKKADKYLKSIVYNGKILNAQYLLIAKFHELIEISELLNKILTKTKKKNLSKLFDYKTNQPRISSFFMNQNYIEMGSCYCCNIDYINAFKDIADYKDGKYFINNAQKHELIQLSGVKEITARKIMNKRSFTDIKDVPYLRELARKQLDSLDFSYSHNHFTLDHFLPQKEYKYLSLCLYNFVPSCYSCNSKFKKALEFENISDLKFVSPSSKDFSLMNDFSFKIYYPKNLKDIKKSTDYKLQKNISNNRDVIQEYLNMFKIEGRYVFHKKELMTLINKKVKYPESTLKKIASNYGLSQDELRSHIFGEELFDSSFDNKPLVKFKRDIAKDINIKGVI